MVKEKLFELPNVPDLSAFKGFERKTTGEFTIGFIGAIRYLSQMKLLIDASEKAGVKVFFAGGGSVEEEEWLYRNTQDKSWIEILGKYNYNRDIKTLYSKADAIYSVYDADNPNVRIANPANLKNRNLTVGMKKTTLTERKVHSVRIQLTIINAPVHLIYPRMSVTCPIGRIGIIQ